MEELKTLKDLQHYNFEGTPINNGVAIDERDLKAEAVKWVKELSEINKERHQEYCFTCMKKVDSIKDEAYQCWLKNHFMATTDWEESSDFSSMIGIIVHFFNLTEGDIK